MTAFSHHSLGGKRFLLLALVLLASCSLARAADPAGDDSPGGVIRNFYRWYVQALIKEREPFVDGRAELKRFATERLIKQIDRARKGPDGLDGDYFLDAQDFDKDWASNITVSTPIVKDKRATVEVKLKGSELGTRDLLIEMALDHGVWKVDKVEGQH